MDRGTFLSPWTFDVKKAITDDKKAIQVERLLGVWDKLPISVLAHASLQPVFVSDITWDVLFAQTCATCLYCSKLRRHLGSITYGTDQTPWDLGVSRFGSRRVRTRGMPVDP